MLPYILPIPVQRMVSSWISYLDQTLIPHTYPVPTLLFVHVAYNTRRFVHRHQSVIRHAHCSPTHRPEPDASSLLPHSDVCPNSRRVHSMFVTENNVVPPQFVSHSPMSLWSCIVNSTEPRHCGDSIHRLECRDPIHHNPHNPR